ncbi:hypothetical protein ScPMuIL_009152 [Solemya velum]
MVSKSLAITDYLKRRPNVETIRKFIADLIEQQGSMEYTRDFLQQLEKRIEDILRDHDENPAMTNMIGYLRNVYTEPSETIHT